LAQTTRAEREKKKRNGKQKKNEIPKIYSSSNYHQKHPDKNNLYTSWKVTIGVQSGPHVLPEDDK
jgi:hypothetical protein